MVEQRMRYLADIGHTAEDSTEHRSTPNGQSSPSRRPGQHDGFASSSRASNAFGGAQSQLNGFMNGHNAFVDHTQNTQLANRSLSLNGMGETSFSNAVFSELGSRHDSSNMQHSGAAEGSTAARVNASWTGGNYNPGGYGNTSLPVPGSYSSSHIFDPARDAELLEMAERELAGLPQSNPFGQSILFGSGRQVATHSSQQSYNPTTNNTVAPPPLQHSGLTSSLDGMDVDATEDDSPVEALVDTKQNQDGDF